MASKSKNCPSTGVAHIQATFSNTKINVTSTAGDTIAWTSGGTLQKGTRKPSAAVAEDMAQKLGKKLSEMGMTEIIVRIKGMGNGRENAIRGLASGGLRVVSIVEVSGIPHNGCRRKKKRRV